MVKMKVIGCERDSTDVTRAAKIHDLHAFITQFMWFLSQ